MSIESVTLKSGVLFIPTPSGGILMDISADRFIALSPVSAAIWRGLSAGQRVQDLVGHIMQAKSLAADQAEALLRHQLERWEKVELINPRGADCAELPQPEMAPIPMRGEIDTAKIAQEPVLPVLLARLLVIESKYRHALRKLGLARTLALLQSERGTSARPPEAVILRTLRNYQVLRRAFKQGRTARDCLLRSFALAAALRRQGVHAGLCIGIIDLPFSAHAWVEDDGLVLNDTLSKCKEHTLICRF